ncbi:nuclear transport factor 2 family protein [Actinomadura rugatobispora]|uniref:Nuclear transport factor 2 family protein n=1 Tax=Actinomadura rugatobispora TaxID=1994 RepID=A0ABW1A4H3_9ACTN|nr:nuclear transport factor 2 family protein [Actinomadura rugatobispora]
MSGLTEELAGLLDRERIRECVALLARGEDRRDAGLIRAAFWPEATVDYGLFQGDLDAYLDWVVPGSPAIPVTQHFLGQSVIKLLDGTALVETQVLSYHRIDTGEEERDAVIGGRYLDRAEKRDGGWRIARRTMLYDWQQDFGLSADWSKGVMGAPFSGDHYTGRAVGDHSTAFFGGRT